MGLSAAEQAEMDELQKPAPLPTPALDSDEEAELKSLQAELPPATSGIASKALTGVRAVAKGLDFQRGAVASGLDRIAQHLGAPAGMTPQQQSDATDPTTTQTAPSYRDLLKNWGVPAGPSVHDIPTHAGLLGLIAQHLPNVTAREASGTAMDMGLDPLTYEGGALEKGAAALKNVPGAGRVADAVSSIPSFLSDKLKAGATSLYESGIKPIIQAGKESKNPNVGETMLKHGIWGNGPALRSGMQEAAGGLKADKDATLAAADAAGAGASKDRAITPMFEQLQNMIKGQRMTPDQGTRILQDLTEAKQVGPDTVAPSLMDVWKTDEGKALPGATFSEVATRSPTMAQQIRRSLQKGYQQEVERSVGASLGSEAQAGLQGTNRELGDLINRKVQRAAVGMSSKYEKTPWLSVPEILTTLGAAGAGAAIGHTSGYTLEGGLGALAAMKGVKAINAPATRTGLGLLGDRVLNAPGVSPFIDAASRRAIVDPLRKSSPYVVPAKKKASE